MKKDFITADENKFNKLMIEEVETFFDKEKARETNVYLSPHFSCKAKDKAEKDYMDGMKP
jgi:hypothetical protein